LLPFSMCLPYTGSWHSTCQISNTFSGASVQPENPSISEALVHTYNKNNFYCEGMLAPRPTPKFKGHPLSAVRDCLFNIFAAILHIWRPSSLSASWGRAMPWWQWTHLTWTFF
jgi:hypothetical protein